MIIHFHLHCDSKVIGVNLILTILILIIYRKKEITLLFKPFWCLVVLLINKHVIKIFVYDIFKGVLISGLVELLLYFIKI